MKINPDGEWCSWNRDKGIGFVCGVQWDSSNALMNRVQQERAHTWNQHNDHIQALIHCYLTLCIDLIVVSLFFPPELILIYIANQGFEGLLTKVAVKTVIM